MKRTLFSDSFRVTATAIWVADDQSYTNSFNPTSKVVIRQPIVFLHRKWTLPKCLYIWMATFFGLFSLNGEGSIKYFYYKWFPAMLYDDYIIFWSSNKLSCLFLIALFILAFLTSWTILRCIFVQPMRADLIRASKRHV